MLVVSGNQCLWISVELLIVTSYFLTIPDIYRKQTKLREGNVFTGVHHSVLGRVVGPSSCKGHTPRDHMPTSLRTIPPEKHGTRQEVTSSSLSLNMVGKRVVLILLECFLV